MALYQLIDRDGTVDRMTFTAAGKSGRIGPTLAECRNYYGTSSSSWWNNSSNYLNMTETGVQQWTVPATGIYEITAKGASGGHGGGSYHPSGPGSGATVKISLELTVGTVINIVCGQTSSTTMSSDTNGSGGGGGTWVYTGAKGGNGLIVVAGGGGGWGHGGNTNKKGLGLGGSNNGKSRGVLSGTALTWSANSTTVYSSGTVDGASDGYTTRVIGYGGRGILSSSYGGGGGGAGWLSDGTNPSMSTSSNGEGGKRWIGGRGKSLTTTNTSQGGFGGGGGGGGNGIGPGGGGGYTGGGAGNTWVSVNAGGNSSNSWGSGGGGGSAWKGAPNTTASHFLNIDTTLIQVTAGVDGISMSNWNNVNNSGYVIVDIISTGPPQEPVPTSDISLSTLKEKYLEYDVISGSGDSYLRDSSTTSAINLSYFNGVTLSDFTVISPPISFSQFSGEELLSGYDYPVFIFSTSFRSQSSFSIDSTSSYGPNKKVTLITSGQTSYGNILPVIKGVNGDNAPAISPTSDYTLWVKLTAVTANYMIGLINRESWRTSWSTCVSDNHKIKSQHAMYADRIMFHAYGYFTYSGNHKPSGTDPVLGTAYSGLGSVFYNKMGYTAGAGGVTSSGQTFVLDNAQKFKSSDVTSYVNAIAIGEHIGMRIKYFTATITATLTSGQNYVVISNQNLDDVFSGMRVTGTNIPTNTVLGDVYTNRIYLRDEYTGELKNASGSGTSTLTLTGQLFQFRKSNSSFSNDLLFGPPHIVLPLKYSTVKNNTTPNGDITDWSMVIGDTIGGTDSQWAFEIVDDRPVLPEPSWSYTYNIWSTATGTDATNAFREISSRVIFDSSSTDYTGDYDVTSLQVNAVGSKRIYLALKVTASTTYYNDICIAGVQRISASGTVLNSWIFNTSTGGTGSTWQTTTSAMSGTSSLLSSSYTPSSAASKSYSSIARGATRDRMNWATSTGSAYTGAIGGISTGSYGSTQFPVGNSKISQLDSTYYAYREVSGSTRYTSTFFRSPLVTFNGTDTIKVVHLITTRSGQPVNANDSIWLGVY